MATDSSSDNDKQGQTRKKSPGLRSEFGTYDKENQEDFYQETIGRKKHPSKERSEADRAEAKRTTKKGSHEVKDFYDRVKGLGPGEQKRFFGKQSAPRTIRGRIANRLASYAVRRWVIGGVGASVVGGAASFVIGLLPLQLPFVSGIFDIEIGGVRDTVLATRSGRLYSRMFFFNDKNEFDGYKRQGMFATLTGANIRSNRYINELRSEGFDFTADLDSRGKWTGTFSEINGVDYTLDSDASFMDHWRNFQLKRGAIKKFIHDNYNPSVTGWRGRSQRSVYYRLGLNYFRGQFIRDWAGQKLNGYAEKLRFAKLRATSGTNRLVSIGGSKETTTDDGDGDGDGEGDGRTTVTGLGEFDEETAARREEVLKNRSKGSLVQRVDDAAANAARQIPGAVLRSVAILGAAEGLCQIKQLFAMVEVGARTIKRLELMEFDIMLSALANAHLAGEVGTAQNVGDFVTQMAKINPETGNEFFGSGVWQWVMGEPEATVHSDNVNKYSVGGGGVSTVGAIADHVDSAISAEACGIVTNPFVQALSIGVGIVALVGSFGTITAIKTIATGIGPEVLLFLAQLFLIPIIIEMAAGTIVNGHESGDEIAAGWVSGRGSSLMVSGGIYGFTPLRTSQVAAIKDEQNRILALENQTKSFGERFFSIANHRSVVSKVAVATHIAKASGPQKAFASFMLNPLGSIFGPISKAPFSRTFAAGPSEQCRDRDMLENELAGDPFCNPIVGLPVDTLAIDPIDNAAWMIENEHADLDGMPISDEYKEYVEKCVNVLDPIHDSTNEFDYAFHDFCYAGITDIASNDGTRRPITPEELAYRQSKTYTFDDLYAYWGVDIDGDGGKAYAQRVGSDPEIFSEPMVIQRFNAFTADRSLLCDIYEHINGITTQELAEGPLRGECRSQRLGLEDEVEPGGDGGETIIGGGGGGGNNCGVGGPNECAGITAGTTLTQYPGSEPGNYSQIVDISSSIDGVIIHGCVRITANNVSITNSQIICNHPNARDRNSGSGFGAAISAAGRSGVIIENNDVICGTSASGSHDAGIAPCDVAIDSPGSIRYNEIHHAVDGINPRSNSVVEYNYIYDLVVEKEEWITICCSGPYSHADGVQVWVPGASNITIRNNLVEGYPGTNTLPIGSSPSPGAEANRLDSRAGILVTTSTSGSIIIENNTVTGSMGAGRIACWAGVCSISNNTVDSRYKGSSQAIVAGESPSVSRCNRFTDGTLIGGSETQGVSPDNSSCSRAPAPRPPLAVTPNVDKIVLSDCRILMSVDGLLDMNKVLLPQLPIQRPGCYASEGIS